MTRLVAPPFRWRFAVLVSGEGDALKHVAPEQRLAAQAAGAPAPAASTAGSSHTSSRGSAGASPSQQSPTHWSPLPHRRVGEGLGVRASSRPRAHDSIPPPFRRVRVLEAPAAVLGAYAEAVRLSGGFAQLGPTRPSESGRGRVGDGLFAGPEPLLREAAGRVRAAHRDLEAAIVRALDSFNSGRPIAWQCGDHRLLLGERPLIMGILNLTPDSFSDGGKLCSEEDAEAAVWRMVEEGADLIDIGGESTRPRATPISAEEEIRRVQPVLARLAGKLPVPISIDTSKAAVARVALDHGVSVINDVTALTNDPEMLPLARSSGAGLVLMHMKGTPATMQDDPHYEDLVPELFLYLQRRVRACIEAGISPEQIAIDPGIGFGKTLDHNLELIARLREFTSLGLPVVIGPSRKRFLGQILGLPVDDRVEGTVAASVTCILNGASVIRVHDVRPVARAARVAAALTPSHPRDPVSAAP